MVGVNPFNCVGIVGGEPELQWFRRRNVFCTCLCLPDIASNSPQSSTLWAEKNPILCFKNIIVQYSLEKNP